MACHLDSEPGLACAARAGQGDEPVVVKASSYLVHRGLPSDEAGQLRRKIVRASGFGCSERREFVADFGMTELRHVLRAGQIAYWMASQIGQPRVVRQPVGDQIA